MTDRRRGVFLYGLLLMFGHLPFQTSGCVMKSVAGSNMMVDDGDIIVEYRFTSQAECFYYCLVFDQCYGVEFNHGDGICTIFSSIRSMSNTGTSAYDVFYKDCSDTRGLTQGLFLKTSWSNEYVALSSITATKFRCSLECKNDTECHVFVFDKSFNNCTLYTERPLYGDPVCVGADDCYLKH